MAPGSWQNIKPRAYKVLKDVFGFEAFRGVQEDAIRAAVEGRDAFVLMPTGGGKSLCYALPAVVQGGLVVVVSPLIALMQDQVASLQARGIAADFLSSSRSTADRKALLARLDAAGPAAGPAGAAGGGGGAAGGGVVGKVGPLALLYVTPELLAIDGFRQKLLSLHARRLLRLLAVDEAHCISSWGHDFRPAYRQLAQLRRQLQGLPCMALTATATQQVQQDILSSLHLRNPALLITSFNRPNIHYTITLLDVQQPATACAADSTVAAAGSAGAAAEFGVQYDDSDGPEPSSGLHDDVDLAGYSHLLPLLKTPAVSATQQKKRQPPHINNQQQQSLARGSSDAAAAAAKVWQGPVAIVYALKRSTVDVLVRRLSAEGLAVAGYHAALPDAVRAAVLQRWRDGKLQVVVATVAFGMGVDKADIELVVHFNLPRSVESFYQESGRAGRAGQPARSVLFYSTRDRRRMDYILQKDADSKAARKRKRAAAKTPTSSKTTTAAAAAAGGDAAEAGTVDPQAAAAALRGFGAVVDLCTQPGCRRAKLLRHFGEDYSPNFQQQQQQQQQQQRGSACSGAVSPWVLCCCDYCDSPGSVEAAQQHHKDAEVALLQRWRGGAGGWQRGGGKRQRLGDGLLDGAGSGSEDDTAEGASDDDDDELDPDSAAAAAAVAKAAAAAKSMGKQGAGGDGTDAFLSAMLRAEQRHERQQQGAAGGSGGDPLKRLMAAKGSNEPSKQAPAGGLTESIRASRRAKLAELLLANTNLVGCTPAAAADVAASLEAAAAAAPGTTALQHRAAVSKLAAAIKAAKGWLQLPGLQQLSGKGLVVVLRQAVDAVAAAAAADSGKADRVGNGVKQQPAVTVAETEQQLLQLAKLPVTVVALEATGVARKVKLLKKHQQQQVAAAAGNVIAAWRAAVASS